MKHGLAKTRIYNIWKRMRQRCNLVTHPAYAHYGGAGITVCEEWNNSKTGFINFYNWSMANGYSEELFESGRGKYSLDRIDGSKGYSPDNCRWATAVEQAMNRRTNHLITVNNETYSIETWIKLIGISRSFVYSRIQKGMSDVEAIKAALKYKNKID